MLPITTEFCHLLRADVLLSICIWLDVALPDNRMNVRELIIDRTDYSTFVQY